MSKPRKVLVCGGTSGIGQGIAKAFEEDGAQVLATGATEAEVNSAPASTGLRYQRLEVCEEAAVRALIEGLGELDVGVELRRHHPARRTRLSTGGRQRAVPAVVPECDPWLRDEPAARALRRRAVAPPPFAACRLRSG